MGRLSGIFVIFTTLVSLAWSETRIIKGQNADIEHFPYQISLRYRRHHVCGGSIYKPNVIITAAHCVTEADPKYLSILAGSADRLATSGEFVLRGIRKIIIHPKYSSTSNDIALLVLRTPLEFGPTIQPIGLPQPDSIQGGQNAVATGWGAMDHCHNLPRRLQFLKMKTFSSEECQDVFRKRLVNVRIDRTMVCGGNLAEQSGICFGDSGGPLAVNNTLIGLSSWVHRGCAIQGYPSVFTNVAHMTPWIEEVSSHLSV